MIAIRICLAALLLATVCRAEDPAGNTTQDKLLPARQLAAPRLDQPAPLMAALQHRKTSREMGPGPLTEQQISEILWSADGVNRPPNGRTSPSALSVYPVEIYVVLETGIYVYEPSRQELRGVAAGDHRKTMGGQDFAQTAPLNLVFVMDSGKYQANQSTAKSNPEDQMRWASVEAGAQAQNVYLYCAAEKLAAVIRAGVDSAKFAAAAKLRPTQKVIIAQTIGQPR